MPYRQHNLQVSMYKHKTYNILYVYLILKTIFFMQFVTLEIGVIGSRQIS